MNPSFIPVKTSARTGVPVWQPHADEMKCCRADWW